ncbi:MAG: hypothetical protein WKF87_10250 [Chryseolinea sp.]
MSEKESLNQSSFGTVIKEIQTITTVCYILAVGIGMLFNFKKYDEFGINIFDYADVLDFLIAPFADVIIVIFTTISVLMAYLLFSLDVYLEKKYPASYARMSLGMHRKTWYALYRYVCTAAFCISYLYIFAGMYGRLKMKRINQQPEISLKFADNETARGIVIGKTKDILFLLTNEQVRAIPISSAVKEFEIK